jgi:hypothetical protein
MDSQTLLDAIRAAIAEGATNEARVAGAHACRTILAALDPEIGPPAAPAPPSSTNAAEILAMVSALRGVPVNQLLDLAIAKLRTMVPADHQPQIRSIKIPIVPVRR